MPGRTSLRTRLGDLLATTRTVREPGRAQAPINANAQRMTRRRWLLWTAATLVAVPLATRQIQRIRRRLPGQLGPTGWFGHC